MGRFVGPIFVRSDGSIQRRVHCIPSFCLAGFFRSVYQLVSEAPLRSFVVS
jgi:hypothetical protein